MTTWHALTSNSATMKSLNLTAVLFTLLHHERTSRSQLSELTGLSATTITNLIAELLDRGIVAEEGTVKTEGRRSVGRPRTALRLVPEAHYAIGIHIGVGTIYVAVTDLLAQPLCSLSLSHDLDAPAEAVLGETAALTERAIRQTEVAREKIVGVGVGASGLVDPHTGVNVFAPNLDWHDVPIQELVADRLQLPVTVENNVRAMALGEALFGAGKGVRTMAFIYARVGVGAGFVVDGQVYRGSGAGAGEIGHMTIIPEGGRPCRCGNTGCLETLISEPIVLELAQKLASEQPGGILAGCLKEGKGSPIERIFAAARQGDSATRAMLDDRGNYLGIALANLVSVFNPELIVLGGFLSPGFDLLGPVTESTMRERAFAKLGERVKLQTTSFGQRAGVVGAATQALNTFFYQQPEAA
ncbi:MAG: ROK family transcriptional regulator [Anaerolineae bacterium]